jgi:adenine-specific DNA-methyltransferase
VAGASCPCAVAVLACPQTPRPGTRRVIFKDAGLKDDVVKTNAVQILQQASIEDVKSL